MLESSRSLRIGVTYLLIASLVVENHDRVVGDLVGGLQILTGSVVNLKSTIDHNANGKGKQRFPVERSIKK